jgi:hypothetical protein
LCADADRRSHPEDRPPGRAGSRDRRHDDASHFTAGQHGTPNPDSLRCGPPTAAAPGEVTPDRYGAGRSLRELASATTFRTHFQDADAVRYHKIIDRVLQRAIGAYLEDHGYSAVEFQRSFERIVNDFRYSRISKSAFGDGARVENNDGARQQEEQER